MTDHVRGLRCRIYVQPVVRRFSGSQLHDLVTCLREMDTHTSLQSFNDCSDLQLDREARTLRGSYRMTSAAWSQISQVIAPGLSKLLPDLAGATTRSEGDELLVDAVQAIRFWNSLVDLRFPLFAKLRMILNDRDRTIEGLVGGRHQYLENLALYQEVVERLNTYHPGTVMYASLLVGRRLAIWFRNQQPLLTRTVDGQAWSAYAGFYFTNGEATGTSVRGTRAVFTPYGVCLGPYKRYGRKTRHVGHNFAARLGTMLADVCQIELTEDRIAQGLDGLLEKSLKLPENGSRELRDARFKKLTHSLTVLGVPKPLAVEIVEMSAAVGRRQGTRSFEQVSGQAQSQRTLLDLFVPLLWTARKVNMARRERMEQAAFEMLEGRFLL